MLLLLRNIICQKKCEGRSLEIRSRLKSDRNWPNDVCVLSGIYLCDFLELYVFYRGTLSVEVCSNGMIPLRFMCVFMPAIVSSYKMKAKRYTSLVLWRIIFSNSARTWFPAIIRSCSVWLKTFFPYQTNTFFLTISYMCYFVKHHNCLVICCHIVFIFMMFLVIQFN